MKRISSFLNRYWRISIAVLAVFFFVDVLIRIFLNRGVYDLHLTLKASELFNNIVTPLVAIITGLFVYRALIVSGEQNKLARSMSIKSNFDREYDSLKDKFNNKEFALTYRPVILASSSDDKDDTKEIEIFKGSEIDLFTFFYKVYYSLTQIEDYSFDYSNYRDSPLQPVDYYLRRNTMYQAIVHFLNPFALHGSSKLRLLVGFIRRINNSNMIDEDKVHFKMRIADELLSTYFNFFDFYRRAGNQFMIPLVFLPKYGKVEWVAFGFSKIGEHYEYFNAELRTNVIIGPVQ